MSCQIAKESLLALTLPAMPNVVMHGDPIDESNLRGLAANAGGSMDSGEERVIHLRQSSAGMRCGAILLALVLAGALVSIAPVVLLYLSGQRFFVRGLTAGIGK